MLEHCKEAEAEGLAANRPDGREWGVGNMEQNRWASLIGNVSVQQSRQRIWTAKKAERQDGNIGCVCAANPMAKCLRCNAACQQHAEHRVPVAVVSAVADEDQLPTRIGSCREGRDKEWGLEVLGVRLHEQGSYEAKVCSEADISNRACTGKREGMCATCEGMCATCSKVYAAGGFCRGRVAPYTPTHRENSVALARARMATLPATK